MCQLYCSVCVSFDSGQGDEVCQLFPESEAHSLIEGRVCSASSPDYTDQQQGLRVVMLGGSKC